MRTALTLKKSPFPKVFAFCLYIIVIIANSQASIAESAGVDVVFELEWGKGIHTKWDGALLITGGKFLEVDNTLMDEGEHVFISNPGTVNWSSLTGGATDGFRVKLRMSQDTRLQFESEAGKISVSAADIMQKEGKWKLGEGRILKIRRSRSDFIRLFSVRDNYIFKPGEAWKPIWRIYPGLPIEDDHFSYSISIADDRSGEIVFTESKRVDNISGKNAVNVEGSFHVPDDEGVYSLYVKVQGLYMDTPDLRVQFVVLDSSGAMDKNIIVNPYKMVDFVQASASHSGDRFKDDGSSELVAMQGKIVRVSGNRAEKTRKKGDLGRTLNWFAYKFNVNNPGLPHLLRIHYPKDKERRIIVSVLEKNNYGKSRNRIDQGILVNHGDNRVGFSWGTKEIVFWPTTKNPAVAFVNSLPGSSAAILKVELFELDHEPFATSEKKIAKRLIGPYFEEAHLINSLGGSKVFDSGRWKGRSNRADWMGYYDSIVHLAQLIKYRGENAVMLPVYAYGGTLYPSQVLKNNGRYDSGIFFGDGRDPVQKDIVRLMLDIFKRYQIKLIPVFVFYSAIAELDSEFPVDEIGNRAVDLVHRSGKSSKTMLKFGEGGKIGPFYNPLHPAVQDKVKEVFREFVLRYGNAAALGDIAIQLNTTSWVVFPGLSWGYDKNTVQRFFEESQTPFQLGKLEENYSSEQLFIILNDKSMKPLWQRWRNKKIADFYGSLAKIIQRNNSSRGLCLSYMNIFDSRFHEDAPHKAAEGRVGVEQLLSAKGIDPIVLSKIPDVRILRPLRFAVPFNKKRERITKIYHEYRTASLFNDVGSDGEVLFFDYFETKLNSLEKGFWWPLDYRIVATFNRKKMLSQYKNKKSKLFFYGGWEVVQ